MDKKRGLDSHSSNQRILHHLLSGGGRQNVEDEWFELKFVAFGSKQDGK